MMTFDVDKDNDLHLDSDGNIAIARGVVAASNVCAHYAKAARKEMIHKTDKGMPFFDTIFGAVTNVYQFEAAFRARMKELAYVIAVESFDATLEDGIFKYAAVIKTTFGEINTNGDLRISNG